MSKNLYTVHKIIETITASIFGTEVDIPASCADGMVGCLPVFKDRESALKYAGDETLVSVITTKETTGARPWWYSKPETFGCINSKPRKLPDMKPCPHCRNVEVILTPGPELSDVHCSRCGMSGPNSSNDYWAVVCWNRIKMEYEQ